MDIILICGIGTYVNQLIECFKDDDTISLNIVLLRYIKEFTVRKFEMFSIIHTEPFRFFVIFVLIFQVLCHIKAY